MMQAALSEHERFIAGVARAIDDPGVARLRSGPGNAITPANFLDIARAYLHQRPELLAMAWLPRVTDAERAAFEAWASPTTGAVSSCSTSPPTAPPAAPRGGPSTTRSC